MHSAPTDELSYYLLPGKPGTDFAHQELHDRTYVFWRNFWHEVLGGLGSDKALPLDDFLRQDRIAVLTQQDRVVAVHLYTMFNLKQTAAREHSYFTRYFPPAFFKGLAQHKTHLVMSMEYFSVAPDWRAAKVGLSLGSVLMGLGLKVAQELGAQAAVGPTRRDNVVTKLAHDLGGISIVSNVQIHNAPCDLVAIFAENAKPAPDAKVNDLIEHFWSRRIDTTDSTASDLRVAA